MADKKSRAQYFFVRSTDLKIYFIKLNNYLFSQALYISSKIGAIGMNHDEPKFEKKLRKFSVVKQCPRCKQLALSYENNRICCSNCGYEEGIPTIRGFYGF